MSFCPTDRRRQRGDLGRGVDARSGHRREGATEGRRAQQRDGQGARRNGERVDAGIGARGAAGRGGLGGRALLAMPGQQQGCAQDGQAEAAQARLLGAGHDGRLSDRGIAWLVSAGQGNRTETYKLFLVLDQRRSINVSQPP